MDETDIIQPLVDSLSPENFQIDLESLLMRIVLAALALLLIWLLRRVISAIILKPVQFFVSRRTATEIDDRALEIIEQPIRLVIVAFGIWLAASIITVDRDTSQFALHLSRTFVISAVVLIIYRLADYAIDSAPRLERITGMTIPPQLLPFIGTALKVLILALGVLIILQEWNFDVTGLIASLGLVGLAFSLGAQDTASNLFAFGAIVGDQPFVVGEYIKTPEVEGIVERVGPRSVRIRQLDQAYVTIPNSTLINSPILNWSRLSKRRLNFTLGVTYSTTSAQMRELLERLRAMLRTRSKVDDDSIVVRFTEFGDSALNIMIICFVHEPDWGGFQAEREAINLEIMDIVADMGLSIAFPSRSIYVEALPQAINNSPTADDMNRQLTAAQSPGQQHEGTSAGEGGRYDDEESD